MIRFHLRMAWRSLRRTPALTAVMLVALSLGIGTWYTEHQIFNLFGAEPLAGRDDLMHVALERPSSPRREELPDFMLHLPNILLTAGDARALMGSGIPRRETVTFASRALLSVEGAPAQRVRVRYATRDLFAMFEVPLAAGEPWPVEADAGGVGGGAAPRHVVLEAPLARRLFGGEAAAIGRELRVDGFTVTVTGVVAEAYAGAFRVYDTSSFAAAETHLYLPAAAAAHTHALPEFRYRVGAGDGSTADLLAGEDGWLLLWVELPDAESRRAFVDHAHRYLEAEQAAGRAGAPTQVALRTPLAWRREVMVVDGTLALWPMLAALALATCLLNLVRLLMTKFAGRTPDLGLLRAFGARRRALVGQVLLEAGLVGLVAGVLGVIVGVVMLQVATSAVLTLTPIAVITLADALLAIVVSTGAALLAAAYPAWRMARGTPAAQLRRR